MTDRLRRSLVVASVDPGATTAIVLVEFTSFTGDGSPRWDRCRWLGSTVIKRPGETKKRPAHMLDRAWLDRSRVAYSGLLGIGRGLRRSPAFVALEEPVDGAAFYNAQEQRGQQTGTAFRLGVSYAMILAAIAIETPMAVPYSYPVRTIRDRRGWMSGSTRLMAIDSSKHLIRTLIQRPEMESVTEHELMALGVLRYWVDCPDAAGARDLAR